MKTTATGSLPGPVQVCCSVYLGEGGSLALGLDGDGPCSALQDLVDVFLTELGALVLLVH